MIPLVGQGAIRSSVMDQTAAHPDSAQIRKMQDLVIQCMDEGAFGLSTGLVYPPGILCFNGRIDRGDPPGGQTKRFLLQPCAR